MEHNRQYEQINNSLNHLHYILRKLGVSEFVISESGQNMTFDNINEIDQQLLNDFCDSISNVYNNVRLKEAC